MRELSFEERQELRDRIRELSIWVADRIVGQQVQPYVGPPEQRAAALLTMMQATTAIRAALDDELGQIAYEAGQTGAVGYTQLGQAVGISRQSARSRFRNAVHEARPGRRRAPSQTAAQEGS